MPGRDGTGPLHKANGQGRGNCRNGNSYSENNTQTCDGSRRRLRRHTKR